MLSPRRALALAIAVALVANALPFAVHAQMRRVEIRYFPAKRTQVAIWIERDDGTFMGTVNLTEAVARRGIGNRPGAMQMNSGFRWPYGRREGVLPVWAHRRASAPGAQQFRRVIFQNRLDEGRASQTSADQSQDNYFCLSFQAAAAQNLDAVSCASTFNSDKGRFITSTNVQNGYSEPWLMGGVTSRRALSFDSLYPPRRDVPNRTGNDHVDVDDFRNEALRVMPELDTITSATTAADQLSLVQIPVPAHWEDGEYVAYIEVNTEKDHNGTWTPALHPTPPATGMPPDYDTWAINYGFAYRGQPSVVYAIPFTLSSTSAMWTTSTPIGYSDIHGLDGNIRPMDASITDDPNNFPGSGADRLRALNGMARASLRTIDTAVCAAPMPPPECNIGCTEDSECPPTFLCGSAGTCVGECEADAAPPAPSSFTIAPYADEKHTHEWATFSFTAPETRRAVLRYDVRVSNTPITNDAEFNAAVNAKSAMLEIQALSLCTTSGLEINCPEPGSVVTDSVGWLTRLSHYYVAVRAYDTCGVGGDIATAEISTTDINFTTVAPCFVATAAYGSPMADDVQTLRRFRDEYLMTNAPGRAFVSTYYAVGPYFAAFIREHEGRREAARALLSPFVALARALDDGPASE